MTISSTDGTLIGALFTLDLDQPLPQRCVQLATHGLGFSILSFLVPWSLGVELAGLISVFLVAASLRDHLVTLLNENRERIYGETYPAEVANQHTSVSLLALFLGSFGGYLGIALWLQPAALMSAFGPVIHVATVADNSLLDVGHFGSFTDVLGHNLSVMVAIFAIASLYRAYGAVLVLSWNAAVWATVLCVVGARSAEAIDTPAVVVFVGSAIGVLPHLIAEALGYCIAAVSAIFTSLALSRYGLDHPRMRSIMTSVSMLLASAVGLLALGALLESFLAPQVLALLANH